MYVLSDECLSCGESAAVCGARVLTGSYQTGSHEARRRCCPGCPAPVFGGDHPTRQVQVAAEPPDPAPVVGAGRRRKRWTQEEEDRVVEAVLELAAKPGAKIEHADAPTVEAFRGLAASRGVTLEHVVRADLRGQLADVVRLPKVVRRRC